MAVPLSPRTVRAIVRAPLVARLAGRRPINDRGVRLDKQLHALLGARRGLALPRLDELGPDPARAQFVLDATLADIPSTRLHRVEDRFFDGPRGEIAARIYTPSPQASPRPALVYLHGGGFVVGNLDTHDGLCRHLADRADLTVISIDYRLAPEHPFPGAVEDVLVGYRWVRAHAEELSIDPARIAVGGDSAGGNLAAALCVALRDAGEPGPAFQLLIYPATDMTRSMESHQLFREGFFLERETMDWFLANYLTDVSQETDPRASPIYVAELGGLPPAHVVTAGFDPLRDEGEAYAMRLMEAGVTTTVRCYGSLIHGFASLGGLIDAARWAVDDLVVVLRDRLHRAVDVEAPAARASVG